MAVLATATAAYPTLAPEHVGGIGGSGGSLVSPSRTGVSFPPVQHPKWGQQPQATQQGAKETSAMVDDYLQRALLSARQGTPEETITQSGTTESQLPTSATDIHGQPSATSSQLSHQNLLAIMPAFAFSMPAQIVVSGINVAMVSVLAVHLLFTVQYHLPLSRANWSLQIASALILLLATCVHLHVMLDDLRKESHQWPFMFPYLAEGLPPGDGSWTTVQNAFFLLMRAITTVVIHLTHIQFLTLLFPSALEARLILWMLGPLALAAAGMEFTWLSPEDDVKTSDLGDAIRNICNSTLTLLYTCALLIWGGLVNRRRAWRSDGGTAAFGGGSMGLAAVNTVLSFVQIRFDRLWWLPEICWTLTIWQSWLGFWWWVGAGMGIGEVEDRAEREARRKKRRQRMQRKLEKQQRQQKKAEQAAAEDHTAGDATSSDVLAGMRRIRDRITGTESLHPGEPSSGTLTRRLRSTMGVGGASARGSPRGEENIELRQVVSHRRPEHEAEAAAAGADGANDFTGVSVTGVGQEQDEHEHIANADVEALAHDGTAAEHDATASQQEGSNNSSSDSRPTGTGTSTGTAGQSSTQRSGVFGLLNRAGEVIADYQPSFIKRRMRRLRLAHAAAAKRAATEQEILRNQVMNANANRQPGLRGMVFEPGSTSASASPQQGTTTMNANATAAGGGPAGSSRRSSRQVGSATATHQAQLPNPLSVESRRDTDATAVTFDSSHSQSENHTLAGGGGSSSHDPFGTSLVHGHDVEEGEDDEWVEDDDDEEAHTEIATATARPDSPVQSPTTTTTTPGNSWAWRGGLRSARLRDRQTYD